MSAEDLSAGAAHMQFMKFTDPFSAEAIRQGVDPLNPVKKVVVDYRDDKVNSYYKRYLLKEFDTVNNVAHIHPTLIKFYHKLQKSQNYKKLGVSFQPGDQPDTVKLVLEPERKNRISGSFDQQIGKDGSFVQEGKMTIRNVLGLLDHLTLEAGKGWGGSLLETYHIKYGLPIFYKDYSMDISLEKSFRDLIPTIKEDSSNRSITFYNDNMYFKFSDILKQNFVDLVQHSKHTLNDEILPMRRLSLKVGRVWNSIYTIDKEYGSRTEASGEVQMGRNRTGCLRLDFNHHTFINPKSFEYKKKIKNINFENYFNCGLALPLFRSRMRMNDRYFTYNVRGFSEVANIDDHYDRALHPLAGTLGFEKLGDYTGDDAYFKNTFKLNFNRFPYLRQGEVVPFLYYSCSYLSGNLINKTLDTNKAPNLINHLKENTRHSAGVGLAKSFGAIKLEILLNMFAKGKDTDRFARFQLRMAVND